MKKRRLQVLFYLSLTLVVILSIPSVTLLVNAVSNFDNGAIPEPYKVDTTFTLDFAKSKAWTIDFQNDNLYFFDHQFVTVEYESCSPYNARAEATVELFIDEDEDGVYDPYDPNGEYLFTLTVGEKYTIVLPYGTEVKKYRLVFANQTPSVTEGRFSVKSE